MAQNISVSWIFRVATFQVGVREADKITTAVPTPFSLFEFKQMPFGLRNAPATFQLLVEGCLRELNPKICLAYLDDVHAFRSTFKETIERFQTVLKRLGDFGLKLKVPRCKFFCTELLYLGNVVSDLGVSPDPDKIAALQEWLQDPPKSFFLNFKHFSVLLKTSAHM